MRISLTPGAALAVSVFTCYRSIASSCGPWPGMRRRPLAAAHYRGAESNFRIRLAQFCQWAVVAQPDPDYGLSHLQLVSALHRDGVPGAAPDQPQRGGEPCGPFRAGRELPVDPTRQLRCQRAGIGSDPPRPGERHQLLPLRRHWRRDHGRAVVGVASADGEPREHQLLRAA